MDLFWFGISGSAWWADQNWDSGIELGMRRYSIVMSFILLVYKFILLGVFLYICWDYNDIIWPEQEAREKAERFERERMMRLMYGGRRNMRRMALLGRRHDQFGPRHPHAYGPGGYPGHAGQSINGGYGGNGDPYYGGYPRAGSSRHGGGYPPAWYQGGSRGNFHPEVGVVDVRGGSENKSPEKKTEDKAGKTNNTISRDKDKPTKGQGLPNLISEDEDDDDDSDDLSSL